MNGTDRGSLDPGDASCDRARDLLADYVEERLQASQMRAVRLHLSSCEGCRREAAARDPLQILAPLSVDGLPERFHDRFWPEIQAQLQAQPVGGAGVLVRLARPWTRHPARTAAWAAAAAALLAALLVPRLLDRRAAEPPSIVRVDTPWIPFREMAMEARRPAPQTVEQVRTPGSRQVQIYSMKYYLASASPAGPERASPPVTELVLIVDEGLDL